MTDAIYSEYGSAFEEFMAGPPGGRNLFFYPAYLIDFLENKSGPAAANCSLCSPAFEVFMNQSGENLSGRGRLNLSSYPDYLGRVLG
ncbi:hypothetical protein [Methanocrinis sp.]|uniref:hypothetical protein n=1 Tax=Methanocrinis sp. TaxID=3101522 RepID=UPI003D12559D